ncbi:DNA-directed RNA polymerase sigma-70 factor [Luteitalea sp. TBR-22]|uniref:ECF-type sigma factor n=1 Tax=Luteitalea sp. TBR-22 TaxID=2802971 RepID=UPI001AF55B9B|nr:ECF-type sigma factor [Luteitalea sp. TBR-22]BCS31966.1 DNA-directed RNA polymerase sigma-70 factor [Luteitalea sp. TBR-22]
MDVAVATPASGHDGRVADDLFSSLYQELHRLARREVHRRGALGGLGVTTLLHEAYLAMSSREGATFVDHARFMGYAARVMRGLIVDDIRRRRALKHGGDVHITALDTSYGASLAGPADIVRLGDALDELASIDPLLAEVVELKFFCGFSFVEIAAMRGVSERTIQRAWEKGRLFLHSALVSGEPGAGDAQAAADA